MKNQQKNAGTIGSRIKAAREERGFSQQDLADISGFKSATAISLIENSERGVSTGTLEALSEALHRDISYFLSGESKPASLQIALRADKDLSKEDKNAILRFIELAKSKKHGK